MIYVKVNDTLFPATITGLNKDIDWDNRESKSIRFEASYETVSQLFTNGCYWAIVVEESVNVTPEFVTDKDGNPVYEQINITPKYEMDPETGEVRLDEEGNAIPYTGEPVFTNGAMIRYNGDPIYETQLVEYDNSAYSIRGDISIHTDGTCTVKMGKPTEIEALKLAIEMQGAETEELSAKNTELQTALNILLGGEI